jgi:hypothetical protein
MEIDRPSLYDIACHFRVSRIPSAIVPGTRLSTLLEKLFNGHPLSPLSLGFLESQRISGLDGLARGEITYEAYLSAMDPALLAQEEAAKATHKAAELKRKADQVPRPNFRSEAREKSECDDITRATEQASQAKVEVLARLAQEAEWKGQSRRNREAATAVYKAQISKQGEPSPTPLEIAAHFRISHLSDTVVSPLSNILDALYKGRELSPAYVDYLKLKGLGSLAKIATGQGTYESYLSELTVAEANRAARVRELESERLVREAAKAARIALENDPAYRLRKKYEIYSVKNSLMEPLMIILENFDRGDRIPEAELAWLHTEAKSCFTEKLQGAHHLREAEYFADAYRRTRDPWNVVNASGHYRRCQLPHSALELIDEVPDSALNTTKIRSAMSTTQGGVMRDLGRRAEGIHLGKQAHTLTPKDFRPCTLLGALYMELGQFENGQDWYAKAEARGATIKSIDNELKAIFYRADKPAREALKAALLKDDSVRYGWVNDKRFQQS